MSQYFDSPEFQEILHRYERAVRLGKSAYLDVQEYIDLSDYYMEAGDSNLAIQLINEGLKNYPDNNELIASKVGLFIDLGRYKQARQLLEQLNEDDDRDYWFLHGQLVLALDHDPDTAQKDFLRWTQLVQKLTEEELDNDLCSLEDAQDYLRNSTYHVAAAYAHLQPEECRDKVIDWVLRYLQQFPDLGNYEADDLLEQLCNELALCDLLEEILRRFLQTDPYRPDGWQHLAITQMMNQHPEEAIDSAEFALAINPDDRVALHVKAEALFDLHNTQLALPLFLRLISKGLNDWDPIQACGIALHTAMCFIAHSNRDEAIPYLDLAIRYLNSLRCGPKHPQAEVVAWRAFHLTLALTACGLLAKALKTAKKAQRCAPDNVDCFLVQRALSFACHGEEDADALIDELNQHPDQLAYALADMGTLLLSLSCYNAARQCFELLLDKEITGFFIRHPQKQHIETYNDVEVNYGKVKANLALICFTLKDRRSMLRYLKMGQEEAPDHLERLFQGIVPDNLPLDDYADFLSTQIKIK